MTNWKNNWKIYAQVLAKAWQDEEYKKKLLEHPRRVLKEEGWDIPEDLIIRINDGEKRTIINMQPVLELPLPPHPTTGGPGVGPAGAEDDDPFTFITSFHCSCL